MSMIDKEYLFTKRCDALEAELDKVATRLDTVTRKVDELEMDQIKMLRIMIGAQNNDIEFGKEILEAVKAVIDADIIEGSAKSAN